MEGHDVTIVSPDNDMAQLVSIGARIWMPPRSKPTPAKAYLKDESWIQQNYGVPSHALLLLRAIIGDPSDNIMPAGLAKEKLPFLKKWLIDLAIQKDRLLTPDDFPNWDPDLNRQREGTSQLRANETARGRHHDHNQGTIRPTCPG